MNLLVEKIRQTLRNGRTRYNKHYFLCMEINVAIYLFSEKYRVTNSTYSE